ncbi:MAG TPA: hypothetical protein VF362_02420 [Demequinaceae bacterium]
MTNPPTPPTGGTQPTGAILPTGPVPRPGTDTNAIYRPDYGTGERPRPGINPANEQTTVLTPVPERTAALNRIPLGERRRWQVLAAALGVAILVLGGLTAYLWTTSDRWAARSASLEGQSYDLGQRLSTEQEYVVKQTEQIDILTQQLSTAQQRITDLADQSAQAGDDVAYAQQEITYLKELVSLGGSVSLALNRCTNEQKTLVGYLQNPSAYTAEGIAQFKSDVDALCAAAQSANAELQKQLAQ